MEAKMQVNWGLALEGDHEIPQKCENRSNDDGYSNQARVVQRMVSANQR